MLILYATQATGNGHLARALEVVPRLSERAQVSIFISGTESDLPLPFRVHWRRRGISLHYGQNGSLHLGKTLKHARLLRLARDIIGSRLNHFDLVVNDFEPITAWSARYRGIPLVGMSHQCAFRSSNVPRPNQPSRIGELILRSFAPCRDSVGFHFQKYDETIEYPIIRNQIRQIKTTEARHVTIYLPSISTKMLADFFAGIPEITWHIFVRNLGEKIVKDNVHLYPIEQLRWLESMASARGLIMGGGFEGPSEAIFLGKRLIVIPIRGHYEQQCNAVALKEMGIAVYPTLQSLTSEILFRWFDGPPSVAYRYPDQMDNMLNRKIFSNMKVRALTYSDRLVQV